MTNQARARFFVLVLAFVSASAAVCAHVFLSVSEKMEPANLNKEIASCVKAAVR